MSTPFRSMLWPSAAIPCSALFWGSTWEPLREIVRAGEPVGLNKLLGGAFILSAGLVDAWGSARSDRLGLKEPGIA